jgi:hypothetical protein
MISPAPVDIESQKNIFFRFLINQRVLARKKLLVSNRTAELLESTRFQEILISRQNKGQLLLSHDYGLQASQDGYTKEKLMMVKDNDPKRYVKDNSKNNDLKNNSKSNVFNEPTKWTNLELPEFDTVIGVVVDDDDDDDGDENSRGVDEKNIKNINKIKKSVMTFENLKQTSLSMSTRDSRDILDVFTFPQESTSHEFDQIQGDFIEIEKISENDEKNDEKNNNLDKNDEKNTLNNAPRLSNLLHRQDVDPKIRQQYQNQILSSVNPFYKFNMDPGKSAKNGKNGKNDENDKKSKKKFSRLSQVQIMQMNSEEFFTPLQNYDLDDRAQRDYLIQLLNYTPETLLRAKDLKILDELKICVDLLKYIVSNQVVDDQLLNFGSSYHPKLSKKGDAVSSTQDNSIFENDDKNDEKITTKSQTSQTSKTPPKSKTSKPKQNPFVEHDEKYIPTFNRLLPFDSAIALGQITHPDATPDDFQYAKDLYNSLISTHTLDNGFASPILPPRPFKSPEPLPFGSILVFSSALNIMVSLETMLRSSSIFSESNRFEIIILHSQYREGQEKIKTPPEPGVRRIILATALAETSVTFPDVTHVIPTLILNQLSNLV